MNEIFINKKCLYNMENLRKKNLGKKNLRNKNLRKKKYDMDKLLSSGDYEKTKNALENEKVDLQAAAREIFRGLNNESRNMKKNIIRLTEGDLHRIVKESVNRILKEGYYDDYMGQSDEPDYCPYCDSHNIENVGGLPNWAGGTGDKWRCNDCGEEFDWDTYISHLPGYQEF